MERRSTGDSESFPSGRRRPDEEVSRLLGRIRTLVAEQRRLETSRERDVHEANRREIDRLHDRLAAVVKRGLAP